ncbi:unnamed protein product [Nesidiocoris tenuis]|uniref:N-acetyltransferase ESCO zinc-finger domain-containing protein n=1 Tax=Nesidiocoris tenuis TaxID=355587 RepID=A0A6H5HIU8_9HEMI|nr:unnamed protein product [Nesidiocoris tenuis]
MIEDEEIGINCKVDDLLSQLEQSDNDENEPNNFENAAASTPVHLPSTPSSSSPMDQKFFPIFNRTPGSGVNYSFGSLTSSAKKNTPALKGLGSDQMLLDCGQSKLREVQCPACDLLYVQGVPEDEAQHSKFHHTFTQMIYNGFKSEYVVGLDGPNKIVMARPQGGDARYWNKALDFKRVVDFELGAPAGDELPDQVLTNDTI